VLRALAIDKGVLLDDDARHVGHQRLESLLGLGLLRERPAHADPEAVLHRAHVDLFDRNFLGRWHQLVDFGTLERGCF
jgi:hypothetical protein